MALVGHAGTAGVLLAAYSGLPSCTAAAHLLAERLPPSAGPPTQFSGGRAGRRKRRRDNDDDEFLLLTAM